MSNLRLFLKAAAADCSGEEPNVCGHLELESVVSSCFTNRYVAKEKKLCRPMARLKPVFFAVLLGVVGICMSLQKADAQVKIANGGNLAVGHNNPTSKLHVVGNSFFNGNVGVGTNNPTKKLQVVGNSFFDGYVGIGGNISTHSKCMLRVYNDGFEFQFKPNNPTPEIGVNYSYINFWHSTWKWHELHAKKFEKMSDSLLKEDILPLEYGTAILKQIKTYSFYYKFEDSIPTTARKRDYGVLAQEIEGLLPDLVSTVQMEDCSKTKLVNYDGFTAILIKGFNEQQTVIEQQQTEIEILQDIVFAQELDLTELYELRNKVDKMLEILNCFCGRGADINPDCCDGVVIPPVFRQDTGKNNNQPQIPDVAVLYQNTPNPFSSNTEISCYVPAINNSAFIYIYNLQGVELMSFPIVQTGYSTVLVQASALPAGMYLYTLVVDGVIIDTKRMILTK